MEVWATGAYSLFKEKLKADVRIETERRLASLKADLAQAQQATKEQALAVRYHKVRSLMSAAPSRTIINDLNRSNFLVLRFELFSVEGFTYMTLNPLQREKKPTGKSSESSGKSRTTP